MPSATRSSTSTLAIGERRQGAPDVAARRLGPAGELLDQPPGDARREQRVAARRRPGPRSSSSTGGVSLSRNPLAPARSASYTYSSRSNVVRISTRVAPSTARRGDPPGGLDARPSPACARPSAPRRDVRGAPARRLRRRWPPRRRPRCRRRSPTQHREPAAHQGLVVGDHHADGHGITTGCGKLIAGSSNGNQAATRKPPPGRGPASSGRRTADALPHARRARWPVPSRALGTRRPGRRRRPRPSAMPALRTATVDDAPRPCRRASSRWSGPPARSGTPVSSTPGGTSRGRAPSNASVTGTPAAADLVRRARRGRRAPGAGA